MQLTIKAPLAKEWTLTDDKVIIANQITIMLSEIIRVDYTKPTLLDNGFIKIGVGINTHRLAFSKKQKEEGEQAYNYIKNNCGGIELLQKEYRKKCNVCGHIFCYTGQDIQNNKLHAKLAQINADAAFVETIAGSIIAAGQDEAAAERQHNKIVDYSKCPKCNSKDLSDATDEEINEAANGNNNSSVSAADELKKFKDLLDMGVISQEEFEAKKKQLLGL